VADDGKAGAGGGRITIKAHGAVIERPAGPTRVAVTGHEFGADRRAVHVPAPPAHPGGAGVTPANAPEARRHPVVAEAPGKSVNVDAFDRRDARARVEAQLRRAGNTLENLPRPREFLWLRGPSGVWPDLLPSEAERLELEREHEAARRRGERRHEPPRPAAPGPRDIDELDQVLRWLLEFLDVDQRAVVLGKALGHGFRRIAQADPRRRSHATLAKIYGRAVGRIMQQLVTEVAKGRGP